MGPVGEHRSMPRSWPGAMNRDVARPYAAIDTRFVLPRVPPRSRSPDRRGRLTPRDRLATQGPESDHRRPRRPHAVMSTAMSTAEATPLTPMPRHRMGTVNHGRAQSSESVAGKANVINRVARAPRCPPPAEQIQRAQPCRRCVYLGEVTVVIRSRSAFRSSR